MSPETDSSMVARLRSVEGHLRAVTTMVENGESCERLLHQLKAIQGALSAIARVLLAEHLKESERIIISSESPQERVQALDYLTMLYHWTFDHKNFRSDSNL